jgi:hypothetical protein
MSTPDPSRSSRAVGTPRSGPPEDQLLARRFDDLAREIDGLATLLVQSGDRADPLAAELRRLLADAGSTLVEAVRSKRLLPPVETAHWLDVALGKWADRRFRGFSGPFGRVLAVSQPIEIDSILQGLQATVRLGNRSRPQWSDSTSLGQLLHSLVFIEAACLWLPAECPIELSNVDVDYMAVQGEAGDNTVLISDFNGRLDDPSAPSWFPALARNARDSCRILAKRLRDSAPSEEGHSSVLVLAAAGPRDALTSPEPTTRLEPAERRALDGYEFAMRIEPSLGGDRAAYDWLKRRPESLHPLPKRFDTWRRQLSGARKRAGKSKHTRRIAGDEGSSIVRRADL